MVAPGGGESLGPDVLRPFSHMRPWAEWSTISAAPNMMEEPEDDSQGEDEERGPSSLPLLRMKIEELDRVQVRLQEMLYVSCCRGLISSCYASLKTDLSYLA
jgi:hypothetical protein